MAVTIPTIRNAKQLGTALARMRKESGLTQSALAERAGIKQPTISEIESSRGNPLQSTFFRILSALDLELTVQRRRPE